MTQFRASGVELAVLWGKPIRVGMGNAKSGVTQGAMQTNSGERSDESCGGFQSRYTSYVARILQYFPGGSHVYAFEISN